MLGVGMQAVVRVTSMKKKLLIMFLLGIASAVSAATNYMANPGFDQGADGLQSWEAFYNAAGGGALAPSNFVEVSSGVALVRGYGWTNVGEKAFYQTFTVASGTLSAGTYQWSAQITNLTDAAAEMFIKVWERDNDWGSFIGAKYQHPVLSNGLMTLTYEHFATNLVQFGFHCYTTNPALGFAMSMPTLTLLSASPSVVTSSIVATPGAAPGVRIWSESGVSYSLESTLEVAAQPVIWQNVDTRTGTGGPLILGTNAPILDRRIFRVVSP